MVYKRPFFKYESGLFTDYRPDMTLVKRFAKINNSMLHIVNTKNTNQIQNDSNLKNKTSQQL